MGDRYNKYLDDYHNAHYQVKANVTGGGGSSSGVGNNGSSHHQQQFSYDVNQYVQPGYESNTHLSSLSNCVKRLQTQLNQYLTNIIDEGSDGTTNYNLGSGEVLNSHLMEQYNSTGPSSPGGGGNNHHSHHTSSSAFPPNEPPNNGYSYYSNYPSNYPPNYSQSGPYGPGIPDYYGAANQHHAQQYSSFQEPKPKKPKNK
ncbi:hypothetical protein RDWZM_005168 [Blomia tropicalis]|uniref:Uncharacterized protein n=1 Tax=Blomia tropicalis TaxID=40697 RepID=A0A9Q0RN86_BLOTA|nr:hypothetical protein BLOT_005620 [Blomia tropicalis]KAJ6219356.1 hypothetical protein RDWZM_005168 [Blomia tropicalis]